MIADLVKRVRESVTLMLTVMVSPRRAFRRVESLRPFVLVWIVGAAFIIARGAAIFQRIGADTILRFSLATRAHGVKLSPTEIDTLRANMITIYPFKIIGEAVVWILSLIVIATVFFEIDRRLFRNRRSYSQVLSIVTYAQMPSILFSVVICILLWSYPNSSSFNINALLGTNAGLLVPPGSMQPFYKATLDSLDVWAIWSVLLVGIGLSSERTRISKALSYVGALWLIYISATAWIWTMILHYMAFTLQS